MKVNKFVLFLSCVLFASSCATINVSRIERKKDISSIDKSTLAVVAFRVKSNLDGTNPSIALPTTLGMLTLGLSTWIFPPHTNYAAYSPKLVSNFNAMIRYHLDQEIVDCFEDYIGSQINWRQELNDKPSISKLIEIAKRDDKRYLYVIFYNEFDKVGYTLSAETETKTNYSGYGKQAKIETTTINGNVFSGSILLSSRMIIDLATNNIIMMNERYGEKYYWLFIPPFKVVNGESDELVSTFDKVGGKDYQSAVKKLVNYLYETDISK